MLPKKFRLSREEFKDVMKNGRLISGSLAGVLVHHPSSRRAEPLGGASIHHSFPKAGIIVSKKLSNKAVVRNKLKRRLRAALQIVLPEIHQDLHFVVLPNRRALTATVEELREEIALIISSKSHREAPAGAVAIQPI